MDFATGQLGLTRMDFAIGQPSWIFAKSTSCRNCLLSPEYTAQQFELLFADCTVCRKDLLLGFYTVRRGGGAELALPRLACSEILSSLAGRKVRGGRNGNVGRQLSAQDWPIAGQRDLKSRT